MCLAQARVSLAIPGGAARYVFARRTSVGKDL
jgi:hypothetical protein